MLRYYVTIAVMLVIMILQYRHYRHLLAAPVIYPVMWIFAFVGLIVAGDTFYEVGIGTCVLFVSGYVLFCLGFRLAMAIRKAKAGNASEKQGIEKIADNPAGNPDNQKTLISYSAAYTIGDQRLGLNIITIICVLTGLAYALILFKLIDFSDLYQSLLKIRRMLKYEELQIPYILVLLRYFIRCSLWYLSLQLFSIPKNATYKDREGYNLKAGLILRILIILGSSIFIIVADFSRNDILFTFLPLLFIYMLAKRLSFKKSFAILFLGTIVFSLFFIWFREFKGGTLEDDFDEEGARNSYTHYLSGSLVALDVKSGSGDLRYFTLDGERGVYTFSLISALKDKIVGTDDTPEVIRERRTIGPERRTTNVYTVYEWTGMDWGLIYALFWQFMFGMLYGILFYGAVRQNKSSVFWYSVLSYSMVMMFFEDQFFSISQSWLIIIAICYGIFFICNRAAVKIRPVSKSILSAYYD